MGALPRLVEMSCAIVHSLLGAVCAQKQILAATASTFGPQAGTFGPGGPSQVHHAAALLLSLTATHFVKTRISRRDWAKLPVKTGKPFSPPLSLLPAPPSSLCFLSSSSSPPLSLVAVSTCSASRPFSSVWSSLAKPLSPTQAKEGDGRFHHVLMTSLMFVLLAMPMRIVVYSTLSVGGSEHPGDISREFERTK